MKNLNYEKVFRSLINGLKDYVVSNNLKSMVLGISGGIDSTIVAAIASEVSKEVGIPLIGRSLPTGNNKSSETNTANLVGNAFCKSEDYKEVEIGAVYNQFLGWIECCEDFGQSKIANGNIQARLRMIYLYNLASRLSGIVLSTDNQTEWNLGFWTIHGDVGDFNPLFGLWKSEVYKLAEYLCSLYLGRGEIEKYEAIQKSASLIPTDGLGISNSDLEQIGASSYDEVDTIFQGYFNGEDISGISPEVISKVLNRHSNSMFKRKNLPIVINRDTDWEV